MPKALVVYDSSSGNTAKMAQAIGEGISKAKMGVEVKRVDETTLADLTAADAIILGSPTQFCTMSDKMKALIDKSIEIYPDKLRNKVGAAFTSSGDVAGGNETTLLSLIQAMLMHRMFIVGHQSGSFGAVSVGKPSKRSLDGCQQFGRRIADFTKRLSTTRNR